MARNDVIFYEAGGRNYPGDITFATAASSTALYKGEPTLKLLGSSGTVVAPLATNSPSCADATALTAGIASSDSTHTATVTGKVSVAKLDPDATWLGIPNDTTAWDTQAEYDALVGARVLFDLTAGSYTVLATDGADNGLVVQPLDIVAYPGKVRFSIRPVATYLGFETGIS